MTKENLCIKYDIECDHSPLSHLDSNSIPSCTFDGAEKCPEAIERARVYGEQIKSYKENEDVYGK